MNVYRVIARRLGWSLLAASPSYVVAESFAAVESSLQKTHSIHSIELLGEVEHTQKEN